MAMRLSVFAWVIFLVLFTHPLICSTVNETVKTDAPVSSNTGESSLVLLYTASAGGQIRSCNCTKFRFGGYGRELTLLKSIRQNSTDTILIEGGDACGGSGFQSDLKTEVIVKALGLLSYQVMVPGEEELGVRGTQYIGKFDTKSVPIICGNLYKSGEAEPIYPSYIILRTNGGVKVGVIGLTDPSLGGSSLTMNFGQVLEDPWEKLDSIIKDIRKKADLIVLVYHGSIDIVKQKKDIQGIDLILATHHSRQRLFPEQGKNSVDVPVEKLDDIILLNGETSTNWCLGRIDLTLTSKRKIKETKHTLLFLDRNYDEDPAMIAVYDAYNEKVKQAVISSASGFKKSAEAILTKRGLDLTQMRQKLRKSPFAGSEKCKDCHPTVYETWSASRHSHAMATLQKTKQEFDPECVRCHATGVAVRNGFNNFKDTPELGNIQCEACHGPALAHVESPKAGFGKTGEETCRSCHTDERTPDFDYESAWVKVKH